MRTAMLAGTLLLAGCAHSNVKDLGNGLHTVSASANWGGFTGSHEETIAQANEYCARSSQAPSIESFEDQAGVNSKGEQTSKLTFRCVQRPRLELR